MISSRRYRNSRLSRRETKKYTRQTILVSITTILLIVVIIFWGIPALVKVAIFLNDIKNTGQPINVQDTIPPSPPILQSLPIATNSSDIKVEGFAEEGSTLVLSVNGMDKYEVVVENDGEFLFNRVQLNGGNNEIKVKSIDSSGNESRFSTTYTVLYDDIPPKLEITSPQDGSSYFGESDKKIQITGNTERDSTLKINDYYVITSQEGIFSFPFVLIQGDNMINVAATDTAGNSTTKTIKVHFEE